MEPMTPKKGHRRQESSISTVATPPSGYVLAQEDTPTRDTFPGPQYALRPGPHDLDPNDDSFVTDNEPTPLPRRIDLVDRTKVGGEDDASDDEGAINGGHGPDFGEMEEEEEEELDTSFGGIELGPGSSEEASGSGTGSFNSESMLEVLDNDEMDDDLDIDEDEFEGEDGEGGDVDAPLVSRGRRRRRRRWDEHEERKDTTLFELIPPLILAHPLPLLPLLPSLPSNFLPAGVVFFIPIYCVLLVLSCCAHIVIVYLAWYLKVRSFEEVFASVTGRFSKYGRWAGRAAVIVSTVGLLVGWFGTLHPLLAPVLETYFPGGWFFSSNIIWTTVPSTFILPTLLPSRMTRSLRRSPLVLALLIPVIVFLVIGRTSEITKAAQGAGAPEVKRDFTGRGIGLGGKSSAGAGITTLAIFLSPHLNTLSVHSTLPRIKRSSFAVPCLIASIIILVLSLPFALVPYYLLPDPTSTTTPSAIGNAGVFAKLPSNDGWVNLARILQCAIALGTCNMWILRCRDCILVSMGVESGERIKAGRWVGLGLWAFVTALACLGGFVAEKVELLGVLATLGVAWLIPAIFFIITFHVRSPLSIIFPQSPKNGQVDAPPPEPAPTPTSTRDRPSLHSRSDSLHDPSTDVLLVRKERQLQKRRLGRRLWQDLIVYIGILPVGALTSFWALGAFLSLW